MAGPLQTLMDQIVALEQSVNSQLPQGTRKLEVYRWQPAGMPDLPAIWNWIGPSPAQVMDVPQVRQRDTFNILMRLGVARQDTEEMMEGLEVYSDTVMAVVDAALNPSNPPGTPPLGGAARFADRISMRSSSFPFSGVAVLGFEYVIACQVDRVLHG